MTGDKLATSIMDRFGVHSMNLSDTVRTHKKQRHSQPMFKSLPVVWFVMALSIGCSSQSESSAVSPAHVLPTHLCSCGDPQADAEGCSNQCFLDPNAQCANPKCTCTVGHDPVGKTTED